MASGKLVISLLGPPEIKLGNKAIQIKRRMFRYLVFYLACQPEPVSRESLCDMFWPNEDEVQSRKNLREMVSKLRRDLPIDDLILTEKEYVSLNPIKIDVDVIHFEETINLIRKNLDLAVTGKISDQLYKSVRDSLDLWRTDHFLGGASTTGSEPFQNWVAGTSDTLQYWRQMMVEWMADHCIVTGNYPEALNWLTLARQFDRINTEVNQLLLTCLRDMHLWSEAVYLCGMLETDYKASEENEIPISLQELISRIREEAKNVQFTLPVTRDEDSDTRGSFVGRDTYLAEMSNTLYRGGILAIFGGSGSGKTELLQRFRERLDSAPFIISYRANPGDERVPYRTMVEGFRKVVKKELWQSIDVPYALTLLPLFPELLQYRNDLNLKEFAEQRLNIRLVSEAFLQILSKAIARKKTLLLIDDAQWLDPETLEVMAYVQEHIVPGVINAIIMSVSTDTDNPHLDALLDRNFPKQSIKVLYLEPLNEDDINELIYQEFHQECSPKVTHQLQHLSGGNPWYLHLMIALMREKKLDLQGEGVDPAAFLDGDLIKLISKIVKHLDQRQVKTLKELSILGDRFSPVLIDHMTGLGTDVLAEEMAKLCQLQILESENIDVEKTGYRFRQEIMAVFLKASLDPMEQRRLHLKAVQAIIDCEGNGQDQAAQLADHLSCAGEYPSALKYWIRAGFIEKGRLHKDRAYEYFQNAFDLIQELGSSADPEDIYRLTNEWGDLALQVEDIDTFTNLNSACLRAGEKLQNRKLIGVGKSGIGWVAHVRGYFDIAEKFLAQAILIFEQEKDQVDLLDAHFRLGTIYFSRQDFTEVIRQYDRVRELALGFDDLNGMFFIKKASAFLIYAYCIAGKLDVAQKLADEGMTIANTLGELNYAAQLKASEAIIRYYSGDLIGAKERVDEILPDLYAMHLDWWVFALLTTSGQVSLEMGDLTSCARIGDLIASFDSTALTAGWGKCFQRYLWGEMLLNLGCLEDAGALFKENIEEQKEKFIELISRLGMAKVEIQQGELKKSKKELKSILDIAENRGFLAIAEGAKLELLHTALEQGNERQLQIEWKKYSAELEQSQLKGLRTAYFILEGHRLIRARKPEKAKAELMAAHNIAVSHSFVWKNLAALEGLVTLKDKVVEHQKTGRKLLEKLKFECEVPELKKPLENIISQWPNGNKCQ